jgi:hypothetical protein
VTERILLVQGDTLPSVVVSIYKDDLSAPLDLRGCTVLLKFRETGATALKATLTGTLLQGYDNGSGVVDTSPPYDLADGRGGRVQFNWSADALDTDGSYEGEIEVTSSSALIQTVYEKLKFRVRAQF